MALENMQFSGSQNDALSRSILFANIYNISVRVFTFGIYKQNLNKMVYSSSKQSFC
jgi:hypothetical protein